MDQLSEKREVARELVEELIGSVIVAQTANRTQTPDINDLVQKELEELEQDEQNTNVTDTVVTEKYDVFTNVQDGTCKNQDTFAEVDSTSCGFIPSDQHTELEMNAQYSADSLESIEFHDKQSYTNKHVRFDCTCDKIKKQNISYVNTQTSSSTKFFWFMTGVVASLTTVALYSRFNRR